VQHCLPPTDGNESHRQYDKQPVSRLCEVLGIDLSCTDKEVKLAYYQKMREYHPDKNGEALQKHERAKLLTQAFRLLCTSDRRRFAAIFDNVQLSEVFCDALCSARQDGQSDTHLGHGHTMMSYYPPPRELGMQPCLVVSRGAYLVQPCEVLGRIFRTDQHVSVNVKHANSGEDKQLFVSASTCVEGLWKQLVPNSRALPARIVAKNLLTGMDVPHHARLAEYGTSVNIEFYIAGLGGGVKDPKAPGMTSPAEATGSSAASGAASSSSGQPQLPAPRGSDQEQAETEDIQIDVGPHHGQSSTSSEAATADRDKHHQPAPAVPEPTAPRLRRGMRALGRLVQVRLSRLTGIFQAHPHPSLA
jgi:hypothetical protein